MKDRNYTHAIQIDVNKCIGCSHCMHECPTKTIRIIDGFAYIHPAKCVDCGECFRVCPQRAIYVQDDGLDSLPENAYKIALVPSVFIGQFPSEYSATQILESVKKLGFNAVFEVEQAIDFLKKEYQELGQKNLSHPVISSYCPAIVRLIQVQYPSLTDQIMQLKAPHDIAAIYLRKSTEKENISPSDIFICYITPCAAKIVAAKLPVGEPKSPIDFTVNMKDAYNKVSKILLGDKHSELHKTFANMSPDSVNWSLSGTEKNILQGVVWL